MRTFFLHTGDLRRQLVNAAARSIVKGTGVMSLAVLEEGKATRITAKTQHIPIAKLRITFLPRVFRGDLPGLASGNLGDVNRNMGFERRVGVADTILEKLQGKRAGGNTRPEWHRPLLQPVFTFWTLMKLPRRVARVMAEIVGR